MGCAKGDAVGICENIPPRLGAQHQGPLCPDHAASIVSPGLKEHPWGPGPRWVPTGPGSERRLGMVGGTGAVLSALGWHWAAPISRTHPPTHPAPAWRGHPKAQPSPHSTWPCLSPCVSPLQESPVAPGLGRGLLRVEEGVRGVSVFFFFKLFFFSKAETLSKGISTSSNRDHLVH